MIIWIIGGILIVWCIINRFFRNGKVEEAPLGMPIGTIRALITILIISFPLTYILNGEAIPSLITSSTFVLVAFYFTIRTADHERILGVLKKTKDPILAKKESKDVKKPLYLPKYSVRGILLCLLVLTLVLNIFGQNIPIEASDTIFDLLVIISFFMFGALIRVFINLGEKQRIKKYIESIENFKSLSNEELLEKIHIHRPLWWRQKGRGLLAFIMVIAVFTSLTCYTINWDYILLNLVVYQLSMREVLLLLINIYYGFRD